MADYNRIISTFNCSLLHVYFLTLAGAVCKCKYSMRKGGHTLDVSHLPSHTSCHEQAAQMWTWYDIDAVWLCVWMNNGYSADVAQVWGMQMSSSLFVKMSYTQTAVKVGYATTLLGHLHREKSWWIYGETVWNKWLDIIKKFVQVWRSDKCDCSTNSTWSRICEGQCNQT